MCVAGVADGTSAGARLPSASDIGQQGRYGAGDPARSRGRRVLTLGACAAGQAVFQWFSTAALPNFVQLATVACTQNCEKIENVWGAGARMRRPKLSFSGLWAEAVEHDDNAKRSQPLPFRLSWP